MRKKNLRKLSVSALSNHVTVALFPNIESTGHAANETVKAFCSFDTIGSLRCTGTSEMFNRSWIGRSGALEIKLGLCHGTKW